ncbi:MAG: inorganic diphosphatase [Candidatus Liptonbacteria bacterium CG11_big_fil_rev_8_21_14_0_20_35_14]|uniref:Inorganic pyrophosphatase n=1 Tax=Candidatus Liptonbacteria bacterium CG11_big_fil_rev_8_21_14_0_20_35_14 TaxID=1974634 RepID=A0A2H0N7W6_9BACT|nr:MAG: inorganic diphosphatase [Candidatus Liptonbacteria bacterium CG11_big_fil_rev_8_21_14_0_20_35_14]
MSGAIKRLGIGSKTPEVFNVVVEVPKGSHNKYEYDEKLNVFTLDRVLYSPVHYPFDYGFIPETRSEDQDHLDCLIIGGDSTFPGCVVRVRPIGILKMIDDGEEDFKILGVQKDNPRFNEVADIEDIKKNNKHMLEEIQHFFRVYKELENKKVVINGWEGSEVAKKEIERAIEAYKKQG